MKRITMFIFATLLAFVVNAEQIQNLTVKTRNASKVAFSWFSTNPNTTQFKVEILNSEKVLVVSMTKDKDYWNDWHAWWDDYTPAENEHYSTSERILFAISATNPDAQKGDAWNSSTTPDGMSYKLVEGTYYIVVTGLGSDNSVTEEPATLEVELKQTQNTEDEEGNIQLNIIGLEAAYITEKDFNDIDHPWWLLIFYTGADETADGLPEVWLTINSGREDAISGTYSAALNNVSLSPDNNCFVDLDGAYANYQFASDVELDLKFSGFYQPFVNEGYYYGTYTGSFKVVTESGKTYIASFNNMLCNSYTYATINESNVNKEYIGMYGEDEIFNAIINVEDEVQPTKVIENGNMYILRNGKRYTVTGAQVK